MKMYTDYGSPRWFFMCKCKKAFETLSKANKAAAKNKQRVYRCPYCSLWHLTSKEKSNE